MAQGNEASICHTHGVHAAMSRQHRLCNDAAFMRNVLERAEVLHLAFATSDFPYVIPFNFALEGDRLYLHTGVAGLKFELIARDPRVGFNVVVDMRIDPENTSTYYQSVSGTGLASLVSDRAEKRHALAMLAQRYGAACGPERINAVDHLNVIRIDIVKLTGKRHMPARWHPDAGVGIFTDSTNKEAAAK